MTPHLYGKTMVEYERAEARQQQADFGSNRRKEGRQKQAVDDLVHERLKATFAIDDVEDILPQLYQTLTNILNSGRGNLELVRCLNWSPSETAVTFIYSAVQNPSNDWYKLR